MTDFITEHHRSSRYILRCVPYRRVLTHAGEPRRTINDRMPVILDEAAEGSWILGDFSKDALMKQEQAVSYHQVTKAVNSPKNDEVFLYEPKSFDDFSSEV